ncbi:apolipoprotein C-I [Chanos chanos]|uniref:Apolipoprotein C-I n=1 Tax=Chanos chanos TaxID=29144 RepID=A0A6J2W2T5_CHACN|nr:apolipoprotein C-I [Chanos chanos]
MKLPIAIAVLMLVLVANTEAEEEPTLEERFTSFGNQMKEITGDLATKTKDAFEKFHQSEFATKTRDWFTEQIEKVKQKMEETFSK